ncbi:hypothetical protein ACMGDI_17180 [Morganella morganii]|uniref:hypothetical protein n=1 Tax=Morganella morganii TaxID=582 RepID=UPI003EC066EC
MKKLLVLFSLLLAAASFSVQAAGQYPDCNDYDKAYTHSRVKNNKNIKYQLQQGWELKGLGKAKSAGMVNSYAGTKECFVKTRLVRADKPYYQLISVNYAVSYRKNGSVQTDIRGIVNEKNVRINKR